jgi:predicted nucleotide-binding protein (sugar kinase/HSP70/actin superfamily)
VEQRIESGLMEKRRFDLKTLADRNVRYKDPFTCRGGRERCDRRCTISRIAVEGRTYPFGGACNRYYNLRHNVRYDVEKLDLVRARQQLVFEEFAGKPKAETSAAAPRVAISRSFLSATLYPLYSTFFTELGYTPVLAPEPMRQGIDQRNAAFCYPAELAHGFFYAMLQADPRPDYIFIPHLRSVPVPNRISNAYVCPLVQGETFYLKATFRESLNRLKRAGTRVLAPLLDFHDGLDTAKEAMVKMAVQMGASRRKAEAAFHAAADRQRRCRDRMQRIGREALAEIEQDPSRTAVVIFGRPYNAFAEEAHMGIPHKLASRGVTVLPLDFLDLDDQHSKRHMYWGMGEIILKAARWVERHPQLFGTYITNFSCGPDSFVIGYFREIMGRKPSLTLELDSHTADAGLETRIEAFLDIVAAYRQLSASGGIRQKKSAFRPARVRLEKETAVVESSSGQVLPMTDPRVTVLFPSMGEIATDLLAAVFKARGFSAYPHPPADEAVLKIGRANTSCKECLPLILTTGTLLNYVWKHKRSDEILVYFMATGSGPCRFGQYYIFMEDLIRRLEIPDVAMFSLTSDNAYAGLGNDFQLHGWWAIVISDLLEDLRSMILANAKAPEAGMDLFRAECESIREAIRSGDFPAIERQLRESARRFAAIPMKMPPAAVPTVNLTGEIFVRRDSLSRQYLVRKLAEMGFATSCTPVAEWLHYSDYLVWKGIGSPRLSKMERLGFLAKKKFMANHEKRIKGALAASGLIRTEPIRVEEIIQNAAPYVSADLTGEAVLTVGGALTEVASHVCGVIAIGPFGCMPNRLSEAILTEAMTREDKLAIEPANGHIRAVLTEVESLPFLAIESDGSPFPQLITAKLEAFLLRARRLHRNMMANGKGRHRQVAN